ncbi:MAG TPA: PTS sugar transporter subunit IIA [Thermoanaerobaculia bacterium]|nr:PTS sugar transporter subunit IIA [Thermoanaerobaculia bacterium]
MQLADLITPNDVVFGVREADIGAAAARLLRTTLPHHGLDAAEVERLVQAVLTRERETSTLCGAIAIPHARDARVPEFIVAIGINAEGVTEAAGAPRVLIAFLSPEARRAEHLELLARLARLSRDQEAISAIAGAKEASTVLEIIRERPR